MKYQVDNEPKGRIWLLIILVLMALAGSIIYFSKDSQDIIAYQQASSSRPLSSREPRTYSVFYDTGVFSPTNIRVHTGDSIDFRNNSSLPIRVVSSDSDSEKPVDFDSQNDIKPDEFYNYTFLKQGIYGYRNYYNPSEIGTVIVRP